MLKANIWNINFWVKETNPQELRKKYQLILNKSGFNIVKFIEHEFKPIGYTAIWLLSESHFAIHTFPEANKSYIELSSCNFDMFINFLNYTHDL